MKTIKKGASQCTRLLTLQHLRRAIYMQPYLYMWRDYFHKSNPWHLGYSTATLPLHIGAIIGNLHCDPAVMSAKHKNSLATRGGKDTYYIHLTSPNLAIVGASCIGLSIFIFHDNDNEESTLIQICNRIFQMLNIICVCICLYAYTCMQSFKSHGARLSHFFCCHPTPPDA